MKKLKIFTIIDSDFKKHNKSSGFEIMFESALNKKLPLHIIVNNKTYDNLYNCKTLPMIEFLKSCHDDELILYVDAFDVIFLDTEEEIIRKFELTNAKFLVSGEIFCYPFDTLQDKILEKTKRYIECGIYKIEPENDFYFKNPCAGLIMGYKNYFLNKILQWKEIMENDIFPVSNLVESDVYKKCDQGACTINYVNTEDFMRVDVYPRVFFNHFYVRKESLLINNGKVSYKKILNSNQEFPSIIHFNGIWYEFMYDFNIAMYLSKNINVSLENDVLKLYIGKKLKMPVTLTIVDNINIIEENLTFDEENKTINKFITNSDNVRIELSYNGYKFYNKCLTDL